MSNQISAKIIADSISPDGQRITTWELEYPRWIHSELNTHRMFSRNAASSRAIPVSKVIDMVENTPAMPVQWGLNQSGMQAKENHKDLASCEYVWKKTAERAVWGARKLVDLGLHKQIVNRVLEPFQRMKTVVTATEYDNWFHLRNHTDAQPEIHLLAKIMYDKIQEATPNKLRLGEWHLPYVEFHRCDDKGGVIYGLRGVDCVELPLEDAIKISASCCAQVSYRKTDESLEKALKIWDMLVTMTPVHASPFEHQATPMFISNWYCEGGKTSSMWEEGITHVDRDGQYWSGNFKGWIQHRQLISNHVCEEYGGE